jgi:hypothetical protein
MVEDKPCLEGRRAKSPFFKGGFRGIIKHLLNPPYPPLEKGGKILAFFGVFFLRENPSYL